MGTGDKAAEFWKENQNDLAATEENSWYNNNKCVFNCVQNCTAVNKIDISYGNTLNILWGEERRTQGIGEETWRNESTWET